MARVKLNGLVDVERGIVSREIFVSEAAPGGQDRVRRLKLLWR